MKYVQFRCPHEKGWGDKSYKCGHIIGAVSVETIESGNDGEYIGFCGDHGFITVKFGKDRNTTMTIIGREKRIDFINMTEVWPIFEVRHE